MDAHLLRACEVVAHKDTQPLRRALFERLAARRPVVRAVRASWQKLGSGRLAAGAVSPLALARFLEVRFPEHPTDFLAVWKYENERRQFAALAALDPTLRITSVALQPSPPSRAWSLATPELRESWSLVRAHARRGDFLVAARVAETVGYYRAMLPQLAQHPARVVLVSSDSNPYAMALVHAARRLGKKTCFVTHGHVAEGPPPLGFDLSLLDGEAVRAVYERAGPIAGRVVLKGSEGIVQAMDRSRLEEGARCLGVVLSILVDWQQVARLLDRLRAELRPARILLRLHPNRALRDPRWADSLDLRDTEVSLGERPLVDDAARCNLVVAGNTSAHLTVLKRGIPSVYLPGLDEMGEDYYGFVRDGIVATPSNESIDTERIRRFYADPQWSERFARFDAGYPDRQPACDAAVVDALHQLVARRSETGP